jgi:hypothetical protein
MMLIKRERKIETGNWVDNDDDDDQKLINCLHPTVVNGPLEKFPKFLGFQTFPIGTQAETGFNFCSFTLRVRRCLAFWLKECVSFVVVTAALRSCSTFSIFKNKLRGSSSKTTSCDVLGGFHCQFNHFLPCGKIAHFMPNFRSTQKLHNPSFW